ncbi:Thymic stromal cotransporter protein [Cyberlindnera fabianii]|uniref:Thymic stromal cotransporter protein n=1 Tax=Cyberlindnera fabianii TaxID=36022 RepID=A0A1V2L9B3_CYBFA|nr:Thymic stromal cotransporter protein [Cyberlindnera fabianii]
MTEDSFEMKAVQLPENEGTMPTICHHGSTAENSTELHELEKKWRQETQLMFEGMPWYKRPSKTVLYMVLSLYTLSFTILLGPLIVLMLESICSVSDTSVIHKRMPMGNIPECKDSHSQETLSNIQTVLSSISGILGFVLSGKYGQWSDVYGHVFVFKVFSVINVIYIIALLCYFEIYGGYNKSLMVLVVSVGFLNGGVMTLIANGASYLNDLVTAEERTVSISLLMSFVYTMLGFGPLLGSLAIKFSGGDSIVVLYLALVFGTLSLILILTVLIETRHPEAQRLAREKYYLKTIGEDGGSLKEQIVRSLKSFFHPLKRFWLPRTPSGSTLPRRNLLMLVFIDTLVMCSTVGTMHTVTLYAMLRYHWSSVELGYYMSLTGFGKAFVLLIVAPVFVKLMTNKLRVQVNPVSVDSMDKTSIVISTLFVFSACLVILLSKSEKGAYISAILQSLAGLISPTIQSSVVKYSSNTTAGEMFGAMALLRHLAMLVAPVFFLQVYRVTVETWPQCFLFVATCLSILAMVLAIFGLKIDDGESDVHAPLLADGEDA